MSTEKNAEFHVGLTATEVSNIWAAYLKNSMELRFLEYFIATTEDLEIKKVIENMINQMQNNLNDIKNIFVGEKMVIPLGFTDEDVRVNIPKAFSDIFILYFCCDISMLSLSVYSSVLSDCTRADIRNHFHRCISFYMDIQNEIVELMLSKGVYLRPPQVAIENVVEFIDEKKYLSGLFGGSRQINVSEISNVSRILHRAQFSKMIFVTFSKLASSKKLSQHFGKGRDEIQKVLDSLQEVLEKENIPISASGEYKTFDVEVSPFSDKLMLYFVSICLGLFCFTMISQAMTSSFRSDIVVKVTKIMDDMKQYYGQGIFIMINEGWLERPPQPIDRRT